MLNRFKRIAASPLIKDSVIYGLTNALYSGLPILILPFLTQVLSPEDYGLVDFYRSLSLVLIPILGLSTVQAIIRFYYDLNEFEFKAFVSNIVYLHFFCAIIGLVILSLISFLLPPSYRLIAFYCIVFFLFNQWNEILLSVYRAEKNPKYYFLIRVLCIVIDLALLWLFYKIYTEFNWTYRVLPNVLGGVFVGIASLFILYRKGFLINYDKKLLKMAIIYSSPLILHMISGYILNLGNRFFILFFLSERDLGNYAVSYQLGTLVNFFYTAFNLAWLPTFFELLKKGNYERIKKIKVITYFSIVAFSGIVLGGVAFILNFTDWFNGYSINFNLILMISLAYIFMSFYKFESNYFFYDKRTKTLSVITLGAALITIIFNIILIPFIGLYGCAIAGLIAALYMFAFTSLKSKKYEKS